MAFELGRAPATDEDAMVAALLAIHRRKQDRARHGDPRAAAYGRIVDSFERRGQRLRGERLVTGELLRRLFDGGRALPAPRVQRELEIAGPRGGTAAGRLRVTNRSGARARFQLVVGEPTPEGLTAAAAPAAAAPALDFEPAGGELDAGGWVVVRVAAAIPATWRAGDAVTLPVECRWAAGADRLWLVVACGDPAAGPPAGGQR